jgi:hypothetical protein
MTRIFYGSTVKCYVGTGFIQTIISRITIIANLELNHLSFSLLVTTQFEVLASLDDQKLLLLRLGAFETEHNLFGCFSLLVEDWFCLTTISRLFSVVTTLTLSVQGSLTSFVLGDLEGGVLVHRLGEGLSCFWHVDHLE